MLTGAVAAPAAPAVGYAIAALASLLAFAACLGLQHAWGATFGPALRWIADLIDSAQISIRHIGTLRPFGTVAAGVRSLDRNVSHALAAAALGTQHAWVYTSSTAAAIVRQLARDIEHGAEALLGISTRLVTVVLPRWERRALEAGRHAIGAASREVTRELRRVQREATAAERAIRRALVRVNHAADHALDWSRQRARTLERRVKSQSRRLSRVEKVALGAGIAALVATGLKRLGLKWLRCSNSRNAAKALCGMDVRLVESLIADTVLIVGTISIVQFASELQAIEGEVAKLVRGFVREV